ncbi:MAG: hypothetical protein HDR00_09900 [Lachnospiraceae bacterium]|nr:hypothetical protein [Lachnospiraceae bacterium]
MREESQANPIFIDLAFLHEWKADMLFNTPMKDSSRYFFVQIAGKKFSGCEESSLQIAPLR